MSLEQILEFLKGMIPGYAAIEQLVAPSFGSEVDDYGQCRANCGSSPASWPAIIATCNTCVNKIFWDAFGKLIPEFAGGTVGAIAIAVAKDKVLEIILGWLEKKGLSGLAGFIPGFGWILLLGEVANVVMTLISLKKVWDAADAANKKFCVCP